MRRLAIVIAAAVLTAAQLGAAAASTRNKDQNQRVRRSAAGTIIQPTRTIIRHPDGTATVIVIPRSRSYLDAGTEVSPGDRGYMDYVHPPGGNPGQPKWWIGPDPTGAGGYPASSPGMSIPGLDSPY